MGYATILSANLILILAILDIILFAILMEQKCINDGFTGPSRRRGKTCRCGGKSLSNKRCETCKLSVMF
jgi:hypothetical protein